MFKAGDVVVLKSGGEAMTVVSTTATDAMVVWMGEEGDLFREALPFVALLPAEFDLAEEEEDEEDDDRQDQEDDLEGDADEKD